MGRTLDSAPSFSACYVQSELPGEVYNSVQWRVLCRLGLDCVYIRCAKNDRPLTQSTQTTIWPGGFDSQQFLVSENKYFDKCGVHWRRYDWFCVLLFYPALYNDSDDVHAAEQDQNKAVSDNKSTNLFFLPVMAWMQPRELFLNFKQKAHWNWGFISLLSR